MVQESDFASNIERFTGFAEIYDTYRPHPPAILLEVLPRLAKIETPNLVVDLGSGTGLSSRFWSATAREVIGIEPTDDMRQQAQARTTAANVSYRKGFSHSTGLPDNCADIVTCSQSLHWMDPVSTFREVARILRSGGVFAAYDYDLPPITSSWEASAAYDRVMDRLQQLELSHNVPDGLKWWQKQKHLARMEGCGCFRFTTEIVAHHVEEGNAERLIGLAKSQGNVAALLKKRVPENELGFDELARIAEQELGQSSKPWYFSIRVRLGIA